MGQRPSAGTRFRATVHTAISGVHKLWTKLLIRCGGREG